METDLYTKVVLTLIAIGLFATALVNTGLFDIPDAHAKAKRGQWECVKAITETPLYPGSPKNLANSHEALAVLNAAKAKNAIYVPYPEGYGGHGSICYQAGR